MPQLLEFIVDEQSHGQRLDKFLSLMVAGHSRSQVANLIANGHIHMADGHVKSGRLVKTGDRITVEIPDPEPDVVGPEPIELAVIYEDAHVIVINKPAGLVVHPAAGHRTGTIVNALLHHCQGLSGIGGVIRPGIVHRLDRDTSGVMVVAKNDASHHALSRQFKEHQVEKRYLAVLRGVLSKPQGIIETLYNRNPKDRKKFSSKVRTGRTAITEWRVIERSEFFSLLDITIKTGRTHQIRVHFSDIGFPVVGDPLYGRGISQRLLRKFPEQWECVKRFQRQALHAYGLTFRHPATSEMMLFNAILTSEFLELLRVLFPGVLGHPILAGLQ